MSIQWNVFYITSELARNGDFHETNEMAVGDITLPSDVNTGLPSHKEAEEDIREYWDVDCFPIIMVIRDNYTVADVIEKASNQTLIRYRRVL